MFAGTCSGAHGISTFQNMIQKQRAPLIGILFPVVLPRKMIRSEIQQKFFARHTQHAITLQAIFAAV